MVSLVVRKSANKFRSYFEDDFESRMWIDESGRRLFTPNLGGLLPAKAAVSAWGNLSPKQFRDIVTGLDNQRKRGGILAVELGFAPPKSVSVAALADEQVASGILKVHDAAVDDALAFSSKFLLARNHGTLVDCGVLLLKFLHPWTKANDPQVHTHILLLRDFTFSHALWTTPLFLLQRCLAEVYHYSLCSRLVYQEYNILVDQHGGLAWELQGVPNYLLKGFSKRSESLKKLAMENPRGYFSQGAEFRVAGWASRRQLPKTDLSVSLKEARDSWRQGMPCFKLKGPSSTVDRGAVDLKHIFRMSSVLRREQFIARHLRWWLGSSLQLHAAIKLVGAILDDHVEKGRLLYSKDSYCFPEAFDAEYTLLQAISTGIGDGHRLKAKGLKPGRVSGLLASDSEVKIISTDGEAPPPAADLRTEAGKRFNGVIKSIRHWDTPAILQEVQSRQGKALVVFVEEPVSVGNFGKKLDRVLSSSTIKTAQPDKIFEFAGRRLKITKGDLIKNLKSRSGMLTRLFDSLFPAVDLLQREGVVIHAPCLTQEDAYDLNWNLLSRKTTKEDSQVSLCRPVSWERLLDGEWEHLGIFAASNTTLPASKESRGMLRTIRHGQTWFFTGPALGDAIPVIGLKRKKKVSLEAIKGFLHSKKSGLLLVQRSLVRLRQGIPMISPVRVESRGQVFPVGHVVVVKKFDDQGVVHFHNGTHWPMEHLVMEAAFVVREFSKNQSPLPTVATQLEPDAIEKPLKALAPAVLTLISSNDPKNLCERVNKDLYFQGVARKRNAIDRVKRGEMVDDLSLLFPTDAEWRSLIKGMNQCLVTFPPTKKNSDPTTAPEGKSELDVVPSSFSSDKDKSVPMNPSVVDAPMGSAELPPEDDSETLGSLPLTGFRLPTDEEKEKEIKKTVVPLHSIPSTKTKPQRKKKGLSDKDKNDDQPSEMSGL